MSKKTDDGLKEAPESLLTTMKEWKGPPFVPLPWHRELDFRLGTVVRGVTCIAVMGEKGVGKTFGVGARLDALRQGLFEQATDSFRMADPIVCHVASDPHGSKGALVDLVHQLSGQDTWLHHHTPLEVVGQAVDLIKETGIRLICIDEAQRITPQHLDLLRQVYDAARQRGLQMGMVFVGTGELKRTMIETGELGQRIAFTVDVAPLTRTETEQVLPKLHPLIPRIEKESGKDEWQSLVDHVHEKANGIVRRMTSIVSAAHSLALARSEPLGLPHIDASAYDLARGY